MVHDEVTHPGYLPTEVKQYLVGERWLSEKGKWNEIDKQQSVRKGEAEGCRVGPVKIKTKTRV